MSRKTEEPEVEVESVFISIDDNFVGLWHIELSDMVEFISILIKKGDGFVVKGLLMSPDRSSEMRVEAPHIPEVALAKQREAMAILELRSGKKCTEILAAGRTLDEVINEICRQPWARILDSGSTDSVR